MLQAENNLVELEKIFRLVDKDHGGTISQDELSELMDTLGVKVSVVK